RVEAQFLEMPKSAQGKSVFAWGLIRTPSGRGVNLLLLKENDDDLYGRWYLFEARPNPMFSPGGERSAPLRYHELEAELPNLGVSLHTLVLRVTPFAQAMFDDFIADVL